MTNKFLKDRIRKSLNIKKYLEKVGVDTSRNPTECIWHSSNNKNSLMINEESYYCFSEGCEAHTQKDVFELIAKLNNLDIKKDFIKVMQIAAKEAGINMEFTPELKEKIEKEQKKEEELRRSHNLFLDFCRKQMDNKQLEYIMNTRGISENTIKRFKIGYLPLNKTTELKKYLKDNNVEDKLIDKYLYLSERHIIPFLRNEEPIHFVGHKLPTHPNQDSGKYVVMNSEYSIDGYKPIFNEDKISGAKDLLITEGFYDTIAVDHVLNDMSNINTIGFGTNHFSKKVLEAKGHLFKKQQKIIISFDNEKNNQGLNGSIETAIDLIKYNINIYINQINRGNEDKLDLCDALKKIDLNQGKINYLQNEIINNKKSTKHIFNIIAEKINKINNLLEKMEYIDNIYNNIFESESYDIFIKEYAIDKFNEVLGEVAGFQKSLLKKKKNSYLKKEQNTKETNIEIENEDNREKIVLDTLVKDTEKIISNVFNKVPMVYDKGVLHVWSEKNKCYEVKEHDYTIDYVFDNTYYVYDKPICHSETRGIIHRAIHQAATRYFHEKLVHPKKDWISFKDCVIDIKTGDVISKDVKKYFMHNTLPFEILPENEIVNNIFEYYDINKLNTEKIDKFFEDWITNKNKSEEENKKNIQLLHEITAYTFYPGYPYSRIFCLLGSGRNGKSTYMDLLVKLIGDHNFTSKKINDISNNRFSKADLYKKLLCSMGEAKYSDKTNEGQLKDLTGGDMIEGEIKNIQGGLKFKNYAKIFLNTQDIPITNDYSDGYMRRWTIIDFPNKFNQKKDILGDITYEDMKNYVIKSMFLLNDLLKRDSEVIFTNEGTIEEKRINFKKLVNPMINFIEELCEYNYDFYIPVSKLNSIFSEYKKNKNLPPIKEYHIKLNLESLGIYNETKRINSEKTAKVYIGIKWKGQPEQDYENDFFESILKELKKRNDKTDIQLENKKNNDQAEKQKYLKKIKDKIDLKNSFSESEINELLDKLNVSPINDKKQRLKNLKKVGIITEYRENMFRIENKDILGD